jgi:O-antigen ligase
VRERSLRRLSELSVLSLLGFTVLWRGGKTLESTWILFGVGVLSIVIHYCFSTRKQSSGTQYDIWPLMILFILWTCASYYFSTTQNYGLDEVLRTAGLGFLLLWFIQRDEHQRDHELPFEEKLFALITFLTALFCFVGILIYIFQPVNRFVGTFFDIRFHTDYWPNAAAQYLLLAWPIVLLWCSRWKSLLATYGPIGLALGSLFATYSRGALIAFVGQVGLLIWLLLRQKGTGKNIELPLRVIGSALFIGLIFFTALNETRSLVHPVQSVNEKLTFSASEGRSSIGERISFWKQAVILTSQKPIFGWGPYSFRFVQPRYQKSVLATSDHPHNVFLKLSMERGVIAALLFTVILFVILKHGVDLALTGKRVSVQLDHARIGYALIVTSVAGVIAHNLIDYNLQFVGIALPFWILLAILLRHSEKKRTQDTILWFTPKRKAILTSCLAMILLAVAFREGYYLLTSSAGRHAEAREETYQAMQWYGKSEGEWFSRDLYLSMAHLSLNMASIEQASSSIFHYLKHNGEDARAWKQLAELYVLENKFPAAIDAYERALHLGGWNDLSISRGLLEVLFAETFTQPTSDAAADALRLERDPRIAKIAPDIEKRTLAFREAIMHNMHFVALSPNPEEAIKIFITLSVLYPEKADTYKSYIAEIDAKTKEERSKTSARPPGWLW